MPLCSENRVVPSGGRQRNLFDDQSRIRLLQTIGVETDSAADRACVRPAVAERGSNDALCLSGLDDHPRVDAEIAMRHPNDLAIRETMCGRVLWRHMD